MTFERVLVTGATGEDGLAAVEILEAVERSAASYGSLVTVKTA